MIDTMQVIAGPTGPAIFFDELKEERQGLNSYKLE